MSPNPPVIDRVEEVYNLTFHFITDRSHLTKRAMTKAT